MAVRLEFRIPISPTDAFYSQVRFFAFALRRLGSRYRDARIHVSVGDKCDIEDVRARNRWSDRENIVWDRVPDEVCDRFGPWGTANWRLKLPADEADFIILSDADTALLRSIDPLLTLPGDGVPLVRGHMAHLPPPPWRADVLSGYDPAFWPWLFKALDIPPVPPAYHYSMDVDRSLPLAPAYFNLGFVLMNARAADVFASAIDEETSAIQSLTDNPMRCQIALTTIGHRAGMAMIPVSAAYNAANDPVHMQRNGICVADIRVLHFLRGDEIDRATIFDSEHIDAFLAMNLVNPANRALQDLTREYAETLMWGSRRSSLAC